MSAPLTPFVLRVAAAMLDGVAAIDARLYPEGVLYCARRAVAEVDDEAADVVECASLAVELFEEWLARWRDRRGYQAKVDADADRNVSDEWADQQAAERCERERADIVREEVGEERVRVYEADEVQP